MAITEGTGGRVRYQPKQTQPVRYPETPNIPNIWQAQYQPPVVQGNWWGQPQVQEQAALTGRVPVTYPRVVQGYPSNYPLQGGIGGGAEGTEPYVAGVAPRGYIMNAGGQPEPPPRTIAGHVGTEYWMNQTRRAMATPGAALQVKGTPAYEALKTWQDYLTRSQKGEKLSLPESLPPYIAEYLNIPEEIRTQYYEKYPTYTPETGYVWRLKPEYREKPKTTGQGVDKRVRYWGGGGGGGGWYGGSEPPPWYLGLMNWRI